MIFGIGVDITAVKRFEKWVNSPDMIERFFNEKEIKFSVGRFEKIQSRFSEKI